MNETRILHVSDTHLGNWQYKSEQRREDFANAFEQSIDIAIEENVDAVIHTGDLFDDTTPHSSTINKAIEIIKKLETSNIPFYAIVGNHERKRRTQWMDVIEKLSIAHRLSKEGVRIGNVEVYGIDSVKRTRWDAIESFGLKEGENNLFKIVCMHELVHPPIPEHVFNKSRNIYTASEVLEKIEIDVDAVALGDYHERVREQIKGVDMFYPGSTEKTAKDESDTKSVDILEIENGKLHRNRKFLDVRDFTTIEIDVIDGMTGPDIEDIIEGYDIKDSVVNIKLTGANESLTSKQIQGIAKRNGALVANVTDNRGDNKGLSEIQPSEYGVTDINTVIDEKIDEAELNETASDIEDIVRDVSEITTKAGVEREAEKIIEQKDPYTTGDSQ